MIARARRTVRRLAATRGVGTVLLGLSVLMLAATVTIGVLALDQARSLQSNVAYTQEAVDSNVRTLGQVQRELLRLQVLLAATPVDPTALALEEAFVDQRTQEGALPYQGQTLGSEELLDRSRALALRWKTDVRPVLDTAFAAGDSAKLAAAAGLVVMLEKDYNQLVSDGEISRKVRAGKANQETQELLSETGMLMIALGITVALFLLFMAVAAIASRRSLRQREAASAKLVALNEELQTHAMVVHATDNLVVITNVAGEIEWVNEAFVRTTGYSLDEVKGRRPGDVLQGPNTDPETVRIMREAVAQGTGFTVEILNQAADGREYWVHIEAHPVRDDAGRVTRFIAIETDVTDRRRTEETLRQATDTALSLAEEKASFLATMSHEIRTPLNAVLGVTALLQDTDLDSEQAGYVATAQRSGNLLLALINDILDFSALESGKIEVETRGFSVRGLMNDVHAMFLTTATGSGLELAYDVADDVPPTVFGDENRIRQVMLNLVSNALKFTTRGGVRMHVGMTRDVDAPDTNGGFALRIAVQDTGIGISADRQERIFQPFTQVDASTTRKYGGTGLGLSICRLIAHHLNGDLELHSEVGKGSCFTFTVPVALTGDTVPRPRTSTIPAPEELSTLRVLLAEDDATNRMVALRMLSRLGVTADVAEDGKQAVEAALEGDYDLVLMDVHMPRMDGVAATAEIHRLAGQGRRPTIVALTATALEGDRERLLSAGMDGYLSKPVTLAALGTLLTGVSDGHPTRIDRERAGDRRPVVTAGTMG